MSNARAECVYLCADDGTGEEHIPQQKDVYFCSKLSKDTLSVSSVLNGISGASGMANLPAAVSEVDFLLWRDSSPATPPAKTADLAKVMRVADALADTRMDAWADVMAQRESVVSWDDAVAAEEMHAALRILSPQTLALVMQRLSPDDPAAYLQHLPPTLHPFFVASMIDSDGVLRAPATSQVERVHAFVAQLRALPNAGHPPLKALLLEDLVPTPSICLGLHDAFASNPQLSRLTFELPEHLQRVTPVLEVFCPSLAAAANLRHLSITHRGLVAPASMLGMLAIALPRVTALATLSLSRLDSCVPTGGELQLSRAPTEVEARQQLAHWRLFLAVVAAHPCLTSLSLTVLNAFEPLPWPEAFPRLQDLAITYEEGDVDRAELRRLATTPRKNAPGGRPACPVLTTLSFEVRDVVGICASPLKGRWLPISADSGECPAMRGLHVNMLRRGEGEGDVWSAFVGALDACSRLNRIDLVASNQVSIVPMAARRIRNGPHLTALHVQGGWHATHMSSGDADDAAVLLCRLSGLRSLLLRAAHDPTACCALRVVHRMAEGRLPHLSSLKLCMHAPGLSDAELEERGDAVVAALCARTVLRVLSLVSCVLRDAAAQQLWRALGAMPRLHKLGLNSVQVSESAARSLAAVLPRLKALTCLDLRDHGPSPGPDIALLVAAQLCESGQPRRRRLRLQHGKPAVGSVDKAALRELNVLSVPG